MMKSHRVAFPSTIQGLTGNLSFHFGHAQAFTIIEYDVEKKQIAEIEIVRNVPHQHGGCMRPVRLLMNSNVNEIVVGGIGRFPLQSFRDVGIDVFQGEEISVKENFKKFIANELPNFSQEGGCIDGD